jgi:CPA1 family monovalent cation:H+ antiporter
MMQGIKYGLMISGIVIVVRLLWIYPVAHLPRWISEKPVVIPIPDGRIH